MSSILAAEIADYRHAELMAEAEMLRRARLARLARRARAEADTADVRRLPTAVRPLSRPRPLVALRAWIVAGQL